MGAWSSPLGIAELAARQWATHPVRSSSNQRCHRRKRSARSTVTPRFRCGGPMWNAALRATIVCLLFGASHVSAQQTTGEVVGRIVDEQGAAIPGATLTARNPATGFVRSDVSDAAGLYR